MSVAVLEYEWKGYGIPDEARAWDVQASVSEFAGCVLASTRGLLADLRQACDEAGLIRTGEALPARKYAGGRWLPLWREVWRSPERAADHLSPEARKAVTDSEGNRRLRWPALARTESRLILQRPSTGGKKYFADFAAFVGRELPEFAFNSSRGWWEAELSDENYQAALRVNHNPDARELQLRISDGVKQWVEKEKNEMRGEDKLMELAKRSLEKYPELTSRAQAAAELVRRGHVKPVTGSRFQVKSQTQDDKFYIVDTEARSCTCYDFSHNAPEVCQGPMCKHRLASLMWLKVTEPDPARIEREQKRIDTSLAAARQGVPVLL